MIRQQKIETDLSEGAYRFEIEKLENDSGIFGFRWLSTRNKEFEILRQIEKSLTFLVSEFGILEISTSDAVLGDRMPSFHQFRFLIHELIKVVNQILEFSILLNCDAESTNVLGDDVRFLNQLLLDVSLNVRSFALDQQVLQDSHSWGVDVVLNAVHQLLDLLQAAQRNDYLSAD